MCAEELAYVVNEVRLLVRSLPPSQHRDRSSRARLRDAAFVAHGRARRAELTAHVAAPAIHRTVALLERARMKVAGNHRGKLSVGHYVRHGRLTRAVRIAVR